MNKRIINLVVLICIGYALWHSSEAYALRRQTKKVANKAQVEAGVAIPNASTAVEPNLEDITIDFKAKRQSVINLVERAKKYLEDNSLDEACRAFTHTKSFVDGELYIFLFDMEGVCFAHAEKDLLWDNMKNYRSEFGRLIIEDIITLAKAGGGWTNYQWNKATQTAWIQKVVKDGKTYAMGAGYYSHSKEEAVINIVKAAVALFDVVKTRGQAFAEAFSDFSYPLGKFIIGDLYLYALDFKGTLMAQGDRPQLIGTNVWKAQDAKGKFVNQEIINKLKETNNGVWVSYTSKRALKHAYAEKVQDAQGNFYAIVCGYYPDTTRNTAKELVRKGYAYMKKQGKTLAANEFTDKANENFRYGDLFLVVHDMKGVCVAHGGNPEMVGQNQYNERDEDGRYYVRSMIASAQKNGSGWETFKKNKSFEAVYFEKVDLGVESFIVSCGLYPISKQETTSLLVQTAKSFFDTHERKEAFSEFVQKNGRFVNGDLEVFVFDATGLCYAYGDDYNLIWSNLVNIKDDNGFKFVEAFITATMRGATKLSYKLNGRTKIAHLDTISKDNKRYIIGSSFYL
ncbi:MAG TPA: cache domain-containing protein [Candidatus Babeliales bacterium]|nr:cache domain-containing protein [Candidatus Babeliales bacterium]